MMKLEIIDQEYLLQVIEHNGNISPLLKKYDYTTVVSALKSLIETGYAEYDKEDIRITDKGKAEHDKLKIILQRKHNGWISPKTDEIISKIKKMIYICRRIQKA